MNTHPTNYPNFKNLNIVSILCALVIPLIISGSFLPDLMVSCLSIWFLYFTLKNKIYYIYKNIYFYIFISFWLVCILSSLLSSDIFFSLKSSVFYFRIGVFSLLVAYLIDQKTKIIDYFYYVFLITFTILTIDGFIQFFLGHNIIGLPIGPSSRVSSFFGTELILGSYLARLLPLFIALFFVKKNKKIYEVLFLIILFLSTYTLVLISGGRSSFLFANIALIFILIFTHKHFFVKIIIVMCLSLIVLTLFIKDDRIFSRWFGPIYTPISIIENYLSNNEKKENFIISAAHDSFFRTSWKMFTDKPIFGHGPKMFRVICDDYKSKNNKVICSTHPHNFYIQILSETGLAGFIFLIGLFIYFIYVILRYLIFVIFYKKLLLSNYQICLLAGLLITIWPISTNGNFFNNKLMIIYGLQIGFFKKKK